MARPKKDIRIKRNGNSLQIVADGVYLGSVSLEELCQMAKAKRRIGTGAELAQP